MGVEGGGGRGPGEGSVPTTGGERRNVLPLEGEVRGPGSKRGAAAAAVGGRERPAEEDRGPAGAGPRCAEGGAVKKVVGPQAEREAVRVVREEAGLSERHACGLIGMHRGSWRYRPRERDDATLRTPAARAGRGAAAIRLPAPAYFPGAGENGERGAAVESEPQAGLPALPGGRAGHAAAETQAISGRSASAAGASESGERSVDHGLHP